MKKRTFVQLIGAAALMLSLPVSAQPARYDINKSELPKPVKEVLAKYIKMLRASKDLDDCAKRFTTIAGGKLVNEDGKTLRGTVQPFSLKKDFSNIKFYANPIEITRVAKLPPVTSGFGPSAIRGPQYKIWIAKKEGAAGMPAPMTILVPEGHDSIKDPKVVSIGSY
ncbi:MAG: hypothetical protein R3B13_12485 [Polyangiaceae bacterium]